MRWQNPPEKASAPDAKRALAFDQGKIDLNIVPPEWIEWIAGPFIAGINKGYPRNNWQQSLNTEEHDTFREKRLNSAHRHFHQYRKGERIDPETGIHHLILGAWNMLCVAWYDINDRRMKAGSLQNVEPGGIQIVG